MSTTHRHDTPERKHYTLDREFLVDLKPKFLYSGTLSKSQDWRDSQHSHTFLEILFIVDGKGIVEIGNTLFHVSKHDIVIYNSNIKHFEHSSQEEPLQIYFIAFDKIHMKDLNPNCILPQNASPVYNASSFSDTLSMLFLLICDEIDKKDEFFAEITNEASRTLLLFIFRAINLTLKNTTLLNKDNILNTVLPYIEKNFTENISLSDIADECFVNKYHLSHVFTENFGMSVGQYIRAKRIDLAKKLLQENHMPLADIALSCGFSHTAYFDRQFKKAMGTTPLQYRKICLSSKKQ